MRRAARHARRRLRRRAFRAWRQRAEERAEERELALNIEETKAQVQGWLAEMRGRG